MTGTVQEDATQVVQFRLGTERYCVEIDRVSELVHMDELTSIPNADAHVEGVMDLRGQTTTIVDPRVVLDVDEDGPRKRVIVFAGEDGDQGDVGWVVDEVEEVRTIPDDDVDTSVTRDREAVRGIVKDEEFKVLLDPAEING
ncbi:chemotaxis protein CheW [Salinarchaeum sp. Harcht-Bsk1]|nr:chemotaxis protein CheW [Salinarchaeum sp. Harcht-Bsk1]